MHRRTFLRVVGQACTAACIAPDIVGADVSENGLLASRASAQPGPAPDASDWETVSALLDDASSTNTEPWDDATCRTLMRGGYLGNGDLGAHLDETRHSLRYYLIGSAARSGKDHVPGKAPGHWGPWNRADDMKWFGNLGMNYNAQNPYYGTFAANHVDLVDPYVQTIQSNVPRLLPVRRSSRRTPRT